MEDEQRQILDMVRAGTLSPDDAEHLLAALENPSRDSAPVVTLDRPAGSPLATPGQFRRYWEYPFLVGVVLLLVTGVCAANVPGLCLTVCGWSAFALAALLALVGWLSQWSPWVHIRIQEDDGSRLAFSLPLPLTVILSSISFVRPFVRRLVDEDTERNLALAQGLIASLGGLSDDEPISIDVEDGGDHVEVFIG